MESEEFKRINIDDCYIDWKHYLVEEEDGSTTIEDWSGDSERVLKEWMEDECACDEFWHADQEKCYLYFIYKNGFSRSKYAEYAKQHNFSDKNIAFWGINRDV